MTGLAYTSMISPTTIFMTSNLVISGTTGGPTYVSTSLSNGDRLESWEIVGMGVTKEFAIFALPLI